MIAMAVVSHQCVAGPSDERGNNSMEEGEDLLSRLRYLRQTLQDCHMRVSVLDDKVESLHSLDVSQKRVDEDGMFTKPPQSPDGFVNGSQTHEGAKHSQELEDDSLLQMSETEFESYSPMTELQSCLTDNHLKHLAQKHASELFNMYWSYSGDKMNDQECSSEKREVKKAVTWSDEYEIFSYVSEACEQNGTEHLESFATSHDYDDVDEIVYDNEPVKFDFDKRGESSERANGNEEEVIEDLIDKDEYKHNSQPESECYWHVQMNKTLTDNTENHERITEAYTTASDLKNMDNAGLDSCKTLDDENTEAESKKTVSLSILNDINTPWFRRAQAVGEDSGPRIHSKRRRHYLIRAKKIDVDQLDVEVPAKTEVHSPEESIYEKFNLCKSEEDSERTEDCKSLKESKEIITEDINTPAVTPEDVSTPEVIPEEINDEKSTCNFDQREIEEKSDEESVKFKVSSTEEMESENASDNCMFKYSSEDDISVSKIRGISEATLPKTDNMFNGKNNLEVDYILNDKDGLSNFPVPSYMTLSALKSDKQNLLNKSNDKEDVAKSIMLCDLADDSLVSNESSEVKSNELLELINNKQTVAKLKMLCQLADDIRDSGDSERVKRKKNIKSTFSLKANQGCNTEPVLNQSSSWDSWDPKSLIAIFMMFLLLFAALFVIYLIITVPLLVVTLRHNGSSVAI